MEWDGDEYQRRFDDLAGAGSDVHGEADLVAALSPRSVLDAGCGTGRVAIELVGQGLTVAGADRDPSMLATARHLRPGGALVSGFQPGRGYGIDEYGRRCADQGLALEERWSTWDRAPFGTDSGYAVSVHRSP